MSPELQSAVLTYILADEGGVSNHSDDKGGVTAFGLTKPYLHTVTMRSWSDDEIRSMTKETALAVYRLWMKMRRLDQLPEDFLLAWIVTDFAVHSGERTAIRSVQKAIGVTPDGIAGAETQGAWHRLDDHDRRRVACQVLADRIELLGAFVTRDPRQAVFAKGWARRVAAQVRACA